MRCVRCGKAIERDSDDFATIAILRGDPPGPLTWGTWGAVPALSVCTRCSRAVGDLLANAPRWFPDQGPLGAEPGPAAAQPGPAAAEPAPVAAQPGRAKHRRAGAGWVV
jgi:hypothetical protein